MTTVSESSCPKCGESIPEGAPRGLCPRCLMDGAAASDPRPATNSNPLTVEQLTPVFPQFEILEVLGSGAMGFVYKARQPHLDRLVALKILPPELARDPMFSERFSREARALARLNHPNIVQCYDFGQSESNEHGRRYFYLVLEYVDGVNLRQTMQTATLSSREALGIVPRLCDALHYAHEQGVLHRDIKPENILIDKKGRVKIADFGLARFQKDEDEKKAMTLTASGAKLGTAAYMAPEQLEQPHEVDHRADIYSLGVVFYEMLTGELPLGRFAAPSETSGVDPRLDNVVFRTLEKQAERRYQSAGEVRTQVETIASTPTPKHKAAAFSNPHHEPSKTSLRTTRAAAFPPSWVTPWTWFWRQPFLMRSGQLTLEPDRLVFAGPKAILTIPLERIEQLSLAPIPFFIEPLGRCPIALRWRDPADVVQETHILIEPLSWKNSLSREQGTLDSWMLALRKAIRDQTGKEPACHHDANLRSTDLIPSPPAMSPFVWGILLCFPMLVAMIFFFTGIDGMASNDEIIGFVLSTAGILLGTATGIVGIGLWRRKKAMAEGVDQQEKPVTASPKKKGWIRQKAGLGREMGVAGLGAMKKKLRPGPKRDAQSDTRKDGPVPVRKPKWSLLAIAAFVCATVGWVFFMTGPVVGCVLGWIALVRVKRADGRLKGRRLALFAALQAPLLLLPGLLATPVVTLWDQGLMPLSYAISLFILALLVFIGARMVLRIAGVKGLWKWKRPIGFTAVFAGALLLVGSIWAVQEKQTRWPFRGVLVPARIDHHNSNRHQIADALRQSNLLHSVNVFPFSEDSDESYLYAVADQEWDATRLLEDAADELRMIDPSMRIRVMDHDSLHGWPPRGRDAVVFFAWLAAFGCVSGLLFSFSGFRSGGLGLLACAALSIVLAQSSLPFPFGIPVQKPDPAAPANLPLPELSNDGNTTR